VIDIAQPGDYVAIEMGWNDAGNFTNPNGRPDCPGSGWEVCWLFNSTTNVTVPVYTYHAYMVWAGRNLTEKGVNVIISSQTPGNTWVTGHFNYTPSMYVQYAEEAARSIGKGSVFVDHGKYVADRESKLNATVVNSFHPIDNTHTNGDGADLVAKAFIKGVKCGTSSLSYYVVNDTSMILGQCLNYRYSR
jgi:rhamnogalacturonan acetylesterase